MTITQYTLEDYTDIIFANININLTDNVSSVIKKLATQLGVSTAAVMETDLTEKESRLRCGENGLRRQRSFLKKNKVPEENWEKMKPFKSTVIEKKEGIEKSINDVRICLNKISSKNYETQRDCIFELINKIIDESELQDNDNDMVDLNKIATSIFEIASTNKFYSELYATLYKELISKFPFLHEKINEFLQNYQDSIMMIVYVDANKDYDKFCENNKLNDRRKAMTVFLVNLMKHKIIQKKILLDLLKTQMDLVLTYIDEENKVNEMEEITENISLFITLSNLDMAELTEWKDIIQVIENISRLKVKEHKSISSRAVFKYMDILDNIKQK
jgi:hypothetical protein